MKADAAALPEALRPPELTVGAVTPGALDDQVLAFPARKPPRAWYIALAFTSALAAAQTSFRPPASSPPGAMTGASRQQAKTAPWFVSRLR